VVLSGIIGSGAKVSICSNDSGTSKASAVDEIAFPPKVNKESVFKLKTLFNFSETIF
jgi:hypothetical protein